MTMFAFLANVYRAPGNLTLCDLCILCTKTGGCFYELTVYYVTTVVKHSPKSLQVIPYKMTLFSLGMSCGFDLCRCSKLLGLSSLPVL